MSVGQGEASSGKNSEQRHTHRQGPGSKKSGGDGHRRGALLSRVDAALETRQTVPVRCLVIVASSAWISAEANRTTSLALVGFAATLTRRS